MRQYISVLKALSLWFFVTATLADEFNIQPSHAMNASLLTEVCFPVKMSSQQFGPQDWDLNKQELDGKAGRLIPKSIWLLVFALSLFL